MNILRYWNFVWHWLTTNFQQPISPKVNVGLTIFWYLHVLLPIHSICGYECSSRLFNASISYLLDIRREKYKLMRIQFYWWFLLWVPFEQFFYEQISFHKTSHTSSAACFYTKVHLRSSNFYFILLSGKYAIYSPLYDNSVS